ncbi:MAG: hypothetical protein ACYTAS_10700 [Planctomycetota bacterium]|jgi:hypothetical protein
MDTYLYLSLIPESLVVSMLPPAEFGTYLATGTEKRSREQAIYFEVKRDFKSDRFDLDRAREACVPHASGRPKHSVYVAIYRVLEHIPPESLGSLWLTTRDGHTLELQQAEPPTQSRRDYHLYQEVCPVHPLIASALDPVDFAGFITRQTAKISVPRICFVELTLGKLAYDPAKGHADDLPYKRIGHLRNCLLGLQIHDNLTKTVNRIPGEHLPYRCIQGGCYVGDSYRVLHYPVPPPEAMERNHHEWWQSTTLG